MRESGGMSNKMAANELSPIVPLFLVQMLMVQMLGIAVGVTAIYFLPLSISTLIMAIVYALICGFEYRNRVYSPISITLLILNVALFSSVEFLDDSGYLVFAPALFLGTLFLVGLICLLIGRPATACYGGDYGVQALHWRTSILWVAVHAIGALLSLVVIRHPEFYWIVPIPTFLGVLLTIWLQLVDMGPAWRRKLSFESGAFQFKQIPADPISLLPFYRHLLREMLPSIRLANRSARQGLDELVKREMENESVYWERMAFFAAYHNGEIVGTISCISDGSTPLPTEIGNSTPIRLDALRKYGKIADISNLSISRKFRFGQDVITGLICAAIEYALEKDTSFLVTMSVQDSVPLYRKIGFQQLVESGAILDSLRVPVAMLGFNLARRVLCEVEENELAAKLQHSMAPYICERYFKRQALRAAFCRKQAWRLSDEEFAASVCYENTLNSAIPLGAN